MPRHYYGTVPALAWIVNHYFYGRMHFNWLAAEFHPTPPNPRSSNPYFIYGEFHAAWRHGDRFDPYIRSSRAGLRNGVVTKRDAGVISVSTSRRLKRVCMRASVDFFYPVVYRVDITLVSPSRQEIAGSGAEAGSREVLVRDLREAEFDLLFDDNWTDPDFRRIVVEERAGTGETSAREVLHILEQRLIS